MYEEWFESWFDSPFYHILYRDRDQQEAANFIDKLLGFLQPKEGAKMMDLACGKGRHSMQLAEKGYKVTGLDLSPQSIQSANKKCTSNLHFEVHDMRLPYHKNHFDYVFSFFTSFGYFDGWKEDLKVLEAVHDNLKSSGIYVLDFLNVQQVKNHLIPSEEKVVDGITFTIRKKIEGDFIFKKISFLQQNRKFTFTERVRLIDREEINHLLSRANFNISHTLGDYQLGKFNSENSPRLITIAQKNNKGPLARKNYTNL